MPKEAKLKTYIRAEQDTLPRVLARTATRYGDKKVALRHKSLGIWHEYTWKHYYDKVRHCTLGLIALGLKPGEAVAVVGNPEPQGYWAMCAVWAAGGITVPLWAVMRREETKYIIQQSEAVIVIAEDQEQVDKVLEMKSDVPNIRKLVYWDPKGLWNYDDPLLMSFDEILVQGEKLEAHNPELFEELVEKVNPDDVAVTNYTSGSTDLAKGAIWTHKAILQSGQEQTALIPLSEDEEVFSLLLGDVYISMLMSITLGITINLAEGPDTVPRDLREVGWTMGYVLGLERQASELQVNISNAAAVERLIYNLFIPVGYKRAEMIMKQGKLNPFWKALYGIGYLLLFRPLLDQHGFHKARNPFVTAVATNPGALKLFHAIGVPARNVYVQQEFFPITSTAPGELDSESVGVPFPGVELRLYDNGEILAKGARCSGYQKNPEKTAELIDDKGWLHTGDAGVILEDGHLVILDRIKDLMTMKSGTVFSPTWVANKLKFSPYISQAIVTGAEQEYVGAIVSLDYNFVGNWAEKCQLPYTSFSDLSQKPEVYDLIRNDIEKRVNKTLPPDMKVKRFAILPKEMDIDDAELTRTWKLRIGYVAERYSDLIESLYRGKMEHMLDVESTYEDGRTARLHLPLRIETIEDISS